MATVDPAPREGVATRSAGRPAQLSRDLIVSAASRLRDVDSLSMRALAAELGVTHGALYRWVRSRDELFDLISEAMVERILAEVRPVRGWRRRLAGIAESMRVNFGQVHGYATHLARPHEHHAQSFERLRAVIVAAFVEAGVEDDLAEQSWYIFVTSVVGWLAFEEQGLGGASPQPRFESFLGVLLRGLPARSDGSARGEQ